MEMLERAVLESKLKTFVGRAAGPPSPAPDPVNEAMIRHWCERWAINGSIPTRLCEVRACGTPRRRDAQAWIRAGSR
jgi:hypothetical protein